jgi:hypothetical protein
MVKLTHFICPQYLSDALDPSPCDLLAGDEEDWNLEEFTPDIEAIIGAIKSSIGSQDETGLHIHGWSKLISGAKVKPRHDNLDPEIGGSRWGDVGHDDYLLDYTPDELVAIVNHALQLYLRLGLPTPACFRAGGWAARKELLRAVVKAGIHIDSSMVPASCVKFVNATGALSGALQKIWGNVDRFPLPCNLACGTGDEQLFVKEVPNGCLLADFVTEEYMLDEARTVIRTIKPGEKRFLHFGFHQESAAATYYNRFVVKSVASGEDPAEMADQSVMEQYFAPDACFYQLLEPVLRLLAEPHDECKIVFVTVSEAARIFLG